MSKMLLTESISPLSVIRDKDFTCYQCRRDRSAIPTRRLHITITYLHFALWICQVCYERPLNEIREYANNLGIILI